MVVGYMRGSVDYGDGLARPIEMCSGMIVGSSGATSYARDEVKASASGDGVAAIILAVCQQTSFDVDGSIPLLVSDFDCRIPGRCD